MSGIVSRSPAAHRAIGLAAGLVLALAGTAQAGPSRVDLGTAGAYAVLAGSGMTNTGVSTIDGDVGSSPTHSQSGFGPCPAADCVHLTGTNHDVADPNDAQTQQAKTDLVTAYDDAFGRTGGTAVTAPLGAGQTLVSGVYTSASDLFVGGDLTLDAGGDPNAVFIFQARTGTLRTAAGTTGGIPNTRVLLSNGAQACNVFWQVGSSATIETFTQFVGDILALQSITVNTSATLDTGRALTRNGAVTLQANTIRRSTCATPTSTTGPATAPTAPPESTPPSAPSAPAAPVATSPTSTPVAVPNRVRVTGPDGDVTGRITITVRANAIVRVVYFIDGRRQGVRRGRTTYRWSRLVRRQRPGVHRVRVVVRFPNGKTTTRRFTYLRPPLQMIPRFAG